MPLAIARRAQKLLRLLALQLLVAGTLLAAGSGVASAFTWSHAHLVDGSFGELARLVACPATAECTTVDSGGGEATFDPQDPGTPVPVEVDSNGKGLGGISCPSSIQCTTVDAVGDEITFNPQSPGVPTPVAVDSGAELSGVACPSTVQCTAVDVSGREVTFDPVSPGHPASKTLDSAEGLSGIACPSPTQCTVATYDNSTYAGGEITFNPQSPVAKTPVALPGYAYGLACFDTTHCTVLAGAIGDEESFDPQSPGTLSPASIDPHNGGMTGVSCPEEDECIAVDTTRHEIMFDPLSPGTPTPQIVAGSFQKGAEPTVSCPTGSQQCTEVDGSGGEVTFDPQSPGTPNEPTVDRGAYLFDLACAAATQCTALEQISPMDAVTLGEVTFDPESPGTPIPSVIEDGAAGEGLACPSLKQCTASDGGNELTFNPQSPGSPSPVPVDTGEGGADAMACFSPTQCTVVDDTGGEATFNPQSPSSPAGTSVAGYGYDPIGLACPSASQCTAIDDAGDELTFNPESPESGSPTAIDTAGGTTAIACPAASQCTTVDSHGKAVTFDPQAPGHPASASIDPDGGGLVGVACPKQGECIAVDKQNNAVVGNPTGSAAWEIESLPGAGGLTAVACLGVGECVTTDGRGQESTGIDAPPLDTGLPSVSGSPVQGQTLTASRGSWTYGPTQFAYRWEDCNSSGAACASIPGAAGQTYKLAARDLGHRLRVREVANNDVGSGGPVSSAPTAAVAGDVGAFVLYSAKTSGKKVSAKVGCRGLTGQSCRIAVKLVVVEKLRKGRVQAVAAHAKKKTQRTVSLGSKAVTLAAGSHRTLTLALNRTGRALLSRFKHLQIAVTTTQSHSKAHAKRTVKLSSRPKRKHK